MAISAMDLQRFARGNCGPDADETTLRAAASRSYYGAFHSLLPFVELLPISDRGDRTARTVGHREMLRRIEEWHTGGVHPKLSSMTSSRAQLVMAMRAMRETRETSDYLLGGSMSRNEVVQQVERGRRVQTIALQIQAIMAQAEGDAAYG